MEREVDADTDFTKMKMPDLKRELTIRGLSTAGNKAVLIKRLQNSSKDKLNDSVIESVEDFEAVLLNDDDDASVGHLDGSESVITDIDTGVDVPIASQKGKRKSDDLTQPAKQAKKVVLNRTASITQEITVSVDQQSIEDEKTEEKKVVKLSELSAKERLEMRAKKFGIELSDDAKKIARAERFNNQKTDVQEGKSNLSVLKQRAERFGLSASNAISNLDNEERKKRRQERFGSAAAANGATQTDKMQKRLDRFKQTVK